MPRNTIGAVSADRHLTTHRMDPYPMRLPDVQDGEGATPATPTTPKRQAGADMTPVTPTAQDAALQPTTPQTAAENSYPLAVQETPPVDDSAMVTTDSANLGSTSVTGDPSVQPTQDVNTETQGSSGDSEPLQISNSAHATSMELQQQNAGGMVTSHEMAQPVVRLDADQAELMADREKMLQFQLYQQRLIQEQQRAMEEYNRQMIENKREVEML